MASASRSLLRAVRSTPVSPALRSSTRHIPAARQAFQRQSRRGYADAAPKSGGSGNLLLGGAVIAALGAGGYYYFTQTAAGSAAKDATFVPAKKDYQKVYNAIAKKLLDEDDYDDGSYGPVLLRLAWHASGTFDVATGTGGSNGATMRFAPESDHGANAGLRAARDFLEPIKEQFPWITYSDLWILAGVCAIQEMSGPQIPWRPGRADRDVSFCTPDGRLPDASKEQKHLRGIFGRMGFNDQEIVALSGAHALGRCHTDRSGFEGPWTFSPITLTNDYYKLLLEEKWQWRKWQGPKQYEDVKSKSLMMLPTDIALIKDKVFLQHVKRYADSNDVFFNEFSDVICKLFELGVPFKSGEESRISFERTPSTFHLSFLNLTLRSSLVQTLSIILTICTSDHNQSFNMTRTHKVTDRDHVGLAKGTAAPEEHLPRYFGKAGHSGDNPLGTKKQGGGKGNWGKEGSSELEDFNYNMTKARRRTNSFSAAAGHNALKTKFETADEEAIDYNEYLHGPSVIDETSEHELEKISTSSSAGTMASVEEEDAAMNKK